MSDSPTLTRLTMPEIVDWNIEADRDIRPGSIELQRTVHKEWHDKIKNRPNDQWLKSKPLWRVRAIDKLEVLLGRTIHGEVLEIGAGTALCSTFAAKRDAVSRVTAMDYDRFCVEEMMPTVFEKFDAPVHKIRRALGSYNHIPEKNAFDFVIGVGALHHAEDLDNTFAEIHSALKPGGVLLVSDVCEFDHVGNRELAERYDAIDAASIQRYGRDVRVKDNGDHWYRLSEWISAGRRAGFELLPYVFDAKSGEPADDEIFAAPAVWDGYRIRVFQPYFGDRNICDSLILILQKPDLGGMTPYIPRQPTSAALMQAPLAGDVEELRRRLEAAEEGAAQQKARAAALKESLERTAQKLEAARGAAKIRGLRGWLRRLFG